MTGIKGESEGRREEGEGGGGVGEGSSDRGGEGGR